jgi:hypothetical protein
MLRTSKNKRHNMTVANFIDTTKAMASQLDIANKYKPEKIFSIRLGKLIDNNTFLSALFRIFKKIYSKPVF